jgi:hypothetical protein
MKANRITRFLSVAMLFTSGIASASPLTFTLQSALLNGAPGDTLTFIGTAMNATGITQNLNSDSFTLQSPLIFNDSLYFDTWPLQLTNSQAFGPQGLFTVSVPLSTSLGLYNGSFDILGGAGINDQNVLATATFQVNVIPGTATPEPATGLLFIMGGAIIALRRQQQRSRFRD